MASTTKGMKQSPSSILRARPLQPFAVSLGYKRTVKNTFLHVENEGQQHDADVGLEAIGIQRHHSEPTFTPLSDLNDEAQVERLRQAMADAMAVGCDELIEVEDHEAESSGSDDKATELKSMNQVDLAIGANSRVSSASTRQISDRSIGESSGISETWYSLGVSPHESPRASTHDFNTLPVDEFAIVTQFDTIAYPQHADPMGHLRLKEQFEILRPATLAPRKPPSAGNDKNFKRETFLDPMPWDCGVKTVMIRQIPRQYTQAMLLQEANSRGFENLFDFLYLPFDFKKGVNVGYGFMNFIDTKYAESFRDEFDGTYLEQKAKHKGKPLRVHPAQVQGYEANYRHFVQTKTGQKQDPHFSPLFFPHGMTAAPVKCQSMLQGAEHQSYTAQMQVVQRHAQLPQAPAPRRNFCYTCCIPHLPEYNFCANCGSRLELGSKAREYQVRERKDRRVRWSEAPDHRVTLNC